MSSIRNERRQVNGKVMLAEAMAAGQAALVSAVSQRLNGLLIVAVTTLLGRGFHVRRQRVSPGIEQTGRCHRCQSHQSQRFSRNGYRERELLTVLGWIPFYLPRVYCECGGSVKLELDGLVRPYQRISDEVDEQIQRWYRLGMSLRHLEEALEQSWMSPLSLHTLMSRIHLMAEQTWRSRHLYPGQAKRPPSCRSMPFGLRWSCPPGGLVKTARDANDLEWVASVDLSSWPWASGRMRSAQ